MEASPAEQSGIRVGDLILRIGGRPVQTWEELFVTVMPRAERELEVVLRRGLQEVTIQVTPEAQTQFQVGDLGVVPIMQPQILNVMTGDPADLAGIRPRDVITAVNGEPITRDNPFVETINANADVALMLTVVRGGQTLKIEVTPALRGNVGLIGVELSPFEVRTVEPGPLQAIQMSFEKNYAWSGLIFQTLGGLLTSETSPKQLVGPLGIAQLSGGAAQIGLVALFTLMAMISLNLGILNLLPIPVLDGGHIFIMALEGLSRRDFSVRIKEKIQLAGFVVLLMLMVTVIYNDLTRINWGEWLGL
jgi:regulator of sigma E protease